MNANYSRHALKDFANTNDSVEHSIVSSDADDLRLERMVDTLNISYAEARDRLGLAAPNSDAFVAPIETAQSEHGIFVTLHDRAVALTAIMQYLNKANMTKGSQIHIENGGARLRERYGLQNVPDVQRGAEANRDTLRSGFMRGIEVLAATDQMRAIGHGEDEIEDERMKMQLLISAAFGVQKAYARERNAVAAKATRAAQRAINRL